MLYLTTQPLHLDPANFRKEEEAIIDAYNKSSKMPNIPLLNILEKTTLPENLREYGVGNCQSKDRRHNPGKFSQFGNYQIALAI